MLLNCGVEEDSWEFLGQKGVKPVNPKGNQSWIFTGRTDAEAEVPILWLLFAFCFKGGFICISEVIDISPTWLIWKDPDAEKDWRQEEGTEDEMVGLFYQLNGHEFEQVPGIGDAQGSLEGCNPWVSKSHTRLSDWSNWTVLGMTCILKI